MINVHLGYDRLAPGAVAVDATAQYGTFCAPFEVAVPEGVTAYTVPSVVGGLLTLSEVSETIPANTPVVLYAEGGYTSEEMFGVAEDGDAVSGMLTGVYEETEAPVGSYVLQNLGGKVGFYQVAEGQQPTVGVNRCYLTVPESNVKAFFFDADDATGIANVNDNLNLNGAIYNLAGQRMSKMQNQRSTHVKGVNIINGKKVLY